MASKSEHFINEDDIGSGEKTPAQREDQEQIQHLGKQQKEANRNVRPQDGSQLHQVVEEQQFLNQQESHTPRSLAEPADRADQGLEAGQENEDLGDQAMRQPEKIPERQPPQHR